MTKALAVGAFGARGSGKTSWALQQLRGPMRSPRVAVFDYKHDPSLEGFGTAYTDLSAFIRALAAPSFCIRYLVNHDLDKIEAFDLFCRACYQAGNLTMWVDELPEVTRASGSPSAGWRKCVNVGRDYKIGPRRLSLTIIATGQRLAEVDHSFLSNLDVLHSGRLGLRDAKRLETMYGIDGAELVALPDLHWIEWRQGQPGLARGVLSFGNRPSVAAKKKPAARRAP